MEQMERIREMLGRLSELTSEQLDELRGLIVDAFSEYEKADTSTETVNAMQELTDGAEQVMAQKDALETAARELEQSKAAMRERINAASGSTETDDQADEAEDADGEETAQTEGQEAAEAVTASAGRQGSSARRMAARTGGDARRPEIDDAEGAPMKASLVAAAATGVGRHGTEIGDRYELAQDMTSMLDRLDPRGQTGKVLIASATWEYPEDRKLETKPGTMLTERDARIMDAVTHPQALVASGGICAPVNVDWDMSTWATPERPLRDALPAFQASRGGLLYRQPPDFSALSGATAVWTEATDLNPGTSTKPVLAIACPSTTTVYVDAVPTRLGFGNMQARFDPEVVATNTDLAIAAAAQIAERNLLTRIQAAALSTVTTAAYLGASRDMLAIVDQFMAAFRDNHRLSDTQVVSAIFPRWVKNMIRADRAREIGHDGQSIDPLAITDEWIESAFAIRHVKPIWIYDGLTTNSPSQAFAALANGAIPVWPDKVYATFFIEGSIQFLDGGRLDLGVVRDATLDATNDYETFVETFEGIAFRGFANAAVNVSIEVVPNGATAGTVTPTAWS
jgi:hypothetical protein